MSIVRDGTAGQPPPKVRVRERKTLGKDYYHCYSHAVAVIGETQVTSFQLPHFNVRKWCSWG